VPAGDGFSFAHENHRDGEDETDALIGEESGREGLSLSPGSPEPVQRKIIDREFSKFTEVNLSVYVHNILWRLRDNPDFPAPNPSLEELRAKLGDLKREVTKLFSGDDPALDSMRATRHDLEEMMRDRADNLEATTRDREKLGTTGFELLREESASDRLNQLLPEE
jgi:hypothetical protein